MVFNDLGPCLDHVVGDASNKDEKKYTSLVTKISKRRSEFFFISSETFLITANIEKNLNTFDAVEKSDRRCCRKNDLFFD